MNTSTTYSRPDTEVEHASLGDLMHAVETMRVRALGATDAEFQHLAMVVVGLAEDLEHMSGLVDGGEVYDARPVHIDGHPEHLYALTEETEYRMARDGNRDLRSDELRNIRKDLDGRSAADVAKAERRAGNAAARDSAERSGGDEKDRKGLFGTIFGSKK